MVKVVQKKMTIKTYSELISLPTFKERYEYCRLDGLVGEETFGFDRYLNQIFYTSKEWRRFRREIILRDNGCDLGIKDREIGGIITVHHLNPITVDDVINRNSCLFDPENVICVCDNTHKAIHYGDSELLILEPIERTKHDTCPWRR